jgi:hypothetical protein
MGGELWARSNSDKASTPPRLGFTLHKKHQFPPLPWGGGIINKALKKKLKKKNYWGKKKQKKKTNQDTKVFEPTRTIQIYPTKYLIARPTYRG